MTDSGTSVVQSAPGDTQPAMSGMARARQVAQRLEIDRAVAYAVLARVWQVASGVITLLLIARWFSPDVQGVYYTFWSLLALQSFVELGLFVVIINLASHEWAQLRFDAGGRLAGAPGALDRLASLTRFAFAWYGAASLAFGIGIGVAGLAFFGRVAPAGIAWHSPWLALVALAAIGLALLPCVSILEGCNQIATVNGYRLVFGIAGSLVMWVAIASRLELWAVVCSAAVGLVRDGALVGVAYRRFFTSLLARAAGQQRISWRDEIWPMQWRLAIQGVVQYFMYSLFTPVLMYYRGAAEAGRMGMTWTAISAVQNIALSWIYTKVPGFGILIAGGDRRELERRWRRAAVAAVAVTAGGGLLLVAVLVALRVSGLRLADRLLGPGPTILLVLGVVLLQIVQAVAAYLRAHKRELLAPASVTTALAIGGLVWLLGRQFGAIGVAAGFSSAVAAIGVPWSLLIWARFRRRFAQTVSAAP